MSSAPRSPPASKPACSERRGLRRLGGFDHGVDRVQIPVGERPGGGRRVGRGLLGLGRARDDAGDGRAREEPRDGELEQRVAAVARERRRAPRPGRTPCRRARRRRVRPACRRAACRPGGASLRRYLPVRTPLASGKYGMNATPSRSQASSTPKRSGPRRSRLYSFCTLTKRAKPRSALIRVVSSICSAEKLLPPISSTLPARTRRVERLERLLERCRGVGEVQLVQVDAIGAEPAQAVFDGRARCTPRSRRLCARRRSGRRTSWRPRLRRGASRARGRGTPRCASRRRCRRCRTA